MKTKIKNNIPAVCMCMCMCVYNTTVIMCVRTYVPGTASSAGEMISRWNCSLFYPHTYVIYYNNVLQYVSIDNF